MAIRRNPNFRFNYYMRSLPSDAIGRRCEQLMKAAEREIEAMEKMVREESGAATDTGGENAPLEPVKLPRFKEIRAMKREEAEKVVAEERKQLEGKVDQIESQMESIQKRLKELQKYAKEGVQQSTTSRKKEKYTEVPEELLSELANLVATSGNSSKDNVASKFAERYPGQMTKKIICTKIDEIARKEKRSEEGDTKMVWYVLPDYLDLLDVETIRRLRKAKEERLKKEEDRKSKSSSKKKHDDDANDDKAGGAPGPDGDMVAFPEYDASEPPRDHKKAFTLFCNATRREVKASLDPASRKDKVRRETVLFFSRESLKSLARELTNFSSPQLLSSLSCFPCQLSCRTRSTVSSRSDGLGLAPTKRPCGRSGRYGTSAGTTTMYGCMSASIRRNSKRARALPRGERRPQRTKKRPRKWISRLHRCLRQSRLLIPPQSPRIPCPFRRRTSALSTAT